MHAIYSLSSSPEQGCVESICGMLQRSGTLDERLKDELVEELKNGIGIHTGGAIVSSMGLPSSPIVLSLGDSVNIAARSEAQTNGFIVPLIILDHCCGT